MFELFKRKKSPTPQKQQDKKGTYVFGSVFPSKKTQEKVVRYLRKEEPRNS